MKKLLLLPFLVLIHCLDIHSQHELRSNKCFTPTLENGWVEAKEKIRNNSFVGRFRCLQGFILTGKETVKCMDGKWNIRPRNFPLCAAIGSCDQTKLPNIINGFRRASPSYKNSVFNYFCKRGYRLIGTNQIICTKEGWSSIESPVCSKSSCDPDHLLLGQEIKHVHVRRMFRGAAYKFKCEDNAVMQGSSLIFCDGQYWNGTVPQCYVAPRSPIMSVFVDGELVDEKISVTEGQEITVSCQPTEGHPTPTLSLIVGEKELDQSNISFIVRQSDSNQHLRCAATNILSTRPVFSDFRVVHLKYGPESAYLSGDKEVVAGNIARYSCSSDEADPVSDISVIVTDQDDNRLVVKKERTQPIMKGMKGFSSKILFSIEVPSYITNLVIECRAANEVGDAVDTMSPLVKWGPSKVNVHGPETVEEGGEATFTCSTTGANPRPDINWEMTNRDGHHVEFKTELTESDSIVSSLLSLPSADRMDRSYTVICTVSNYIGSVEQTFSSLVAYGPKTTYLSGDKEVVAGHIARYSCSSEESDPVSDISVIVTDQDDNKLVVNKEKTQPSINGRGGFSSKILFSIDIPSDVTNIVIECRAANEVGEAVDTMRPLVKYPPKTVTISGPSIVDQLDEAKFSCMSSVSNPEPTIEWHIIESDSGDHVVIDEENTIVETETNKNGGVIKISNVTLPYSRSQKTTIFCIPYIKELGFEKVSDELELVRAFSPKRIFIDGPDEIIKGGNADYTCNVEGGNPEPQVSMTVEDTEGNVVDKIENSIINLNPDIDSDMTFISIKCSASNRAGTLQNNKKVNFHWGPSEVNIYGPEIVGEGKEAQFTCSTAEANPRPEISWEMTNSAGHLVEFKTELTESDSIVSSLLSLPSADRMDRSYTVICTVSNYIGSVEQNLSSFVTYKAKQLNIKGPDNVEVYANNNETFAYECSTDDSFPASDLHWTIDGEKTEENVETFLTLLKSGGVQTNSVVILQPEAGAVIILECYEGDLNETMTVQVDEISQSTEAVFIVTEVWEVLNDTIDEGLKDMDIDTGLTNIDIDEGLNSIEINTGLEHMEINEGLEDNKNDTGLKHEEVVSGLIDFKIDAGLKHTEIDKGLKDINIQNNVTQVGEFQANNKLEPLQENFEDIQYESKWLSEREMENYEDEEYEKYKESKTNIQEKHLEDNSKDIHQDELEKYIEKDMLESKETEYGQFGESPTYSQRKQLEENHKYIYPDGVENLIEKEMKEFKHKEYGQFKESQTDIPGKYLGENLKGIYQDEIKSLIEKKIEEDENEELGQFRESPTDKPGKRLGENLKYVHQIELESKIEKEIIEITDDNDGEFVKLEPVEFSTRNKIEKSQPTEQSAVDYKNHEIFDDSKFIANEKYFPTNVDHVEEPNFFRSEVESSNVPLKQSESLGLTAYLPPLAVTAGVQRLFLSNICSLFLSVLIVVKLI